MPETKRLSNIELMRTLDDAWNAQDWETFEKRHAVDTVVFWPGWAEPTCGRDNHKAESVEFFKTFPDNHLINHPYKVEIAPVCDQFPAVPSPACTVWLATRMTPK